MTDEQAETDVVLAGAAMDAYAPLGPIGLLVGGAIALLSLLPRLLRKMHRRYNRASNAR